MSRRRRELAELKAQTAWAERLDLRGADGLDDPTAQFAALVQELNKRIRTITAGVRAAQRSGDAARIRRARHAWFTATAQRVEARRMLRWLTTGRLFTLPPMGRAIAAGRRLGETESEWLARRTKVKARRGGTRAQEGGR